MVEPLFSIVIPTRNRAETLRYSLRTCLDLDFDDYEIIVCDNFSSPETKSAVDETDSERIRYFRSDEYLPMSANWELAVSKARGTYLFVLGDDDGIMPFALRQLAYLIAEHSSPPAIRWTGGHYNWPTITVPEEANFLAIPLARHSEVEDGRSQLVRAARQEVGFDKFPCLNTAIVRRDVLEKHRKTAGRVFATRYPDVFSGFSVAWLARTYLAISVPMHVAGLASKSNGAATLMRADANPIATEFEESNRKGGYARHPTVPDCELWPIHGADSFQHVRDIYFPDEPDLSLDRKDMVRRYLSAITATDPEHRKEIRGRIRDSLVDVPELLTWFDRDAPEFQPAQPMKLKPGRFGFDGNYLTLDTTGLPIADIAGAVRFAAQVLQIGQAPLVFDLPDAQTLNGRLAVLTKHLDETLGEVSELRAQLDQQTAKLNAAQGALDKCEERNNRKRSKKKKPGRGLFARF